MKLNARLRTLTFHAEVLCKVFSVVVDKCTVSCHILRNILFALPPFLEPQLIKNSAAYPEASFYWALRQ